MPIACIDDLPEMNGMNIIRIAQPMKEFSRATLKLLKNQNRHGKDWKSGTHRLKGKLKIPNMRRSS